MNPDSPRRFVAIDYGTGESIGVIAHITASETGQIVIERIETTDAHQLVAERVVPPELSLPEIIEAPVERKKSWRRQQRELPKFLR